jgi:hypothetical protein
MPFWALPVSLIACPQLGQTLAASLIRLAHFGHFVPVVKANANPMGPSKTPMPNHRQPFAPRLLATTAALMPNKSQIMRNSTT